MAELIRMIRDLIRPRKSEKPDTLLLSGKKRAAQDNYSYFSAKIRRLDDYNMEPVNYDDWSDFPSTSKARFANLHPQRRNPIRPLSMRNPEVINLSDDDDVVEITPRRNIAIFNGNGLSGSKPRSVSPEDVFTEARRTLKNCRRVLNNPQDLNQTIRLDEQQLYQDMLMNFPRTSSVYRHNTTSTPNFGRKYEGSTRSSRILQLLQDKKPSAVVDLTDDKTHKNHEAIVIKDDSDVDSVASKKKIDPVNSFKKVVDKVPFMNPNFLTSFEEMHLQRKKEFEKEVQEKRKQRDLFNNANRQNMNTILEAKIKNCRITDIVLLDEPPEEELSFPEFTPQQEAKINDALKCRNPNRIFIDKYNLKITAHDLRTFNEKEWLNDEVINFYVNMIQERSQLANLPKVYAFSTFFYPKLISKGYNSLRRWTKKVDIFSHDIIVVPVHLGFHWCMAIIDFRDKSIRYYDSMLGKNMQCLNALEMYLIEEYKDKKKADFSTGNWRKMIMKDIPRQMNGSDCGVFACTFAEFITRNAKILFTQEHMPYIRRKMVIEIIEGQLIT